MSPVPHPRRWMTTAALVVALLAVPMANAHAQSSPDTTRRPDGFDLQGHRGARGLAPENTIPAFRRALALGVPTLEMDVVVSADGVVVVSHEPWMAREKCLAPDGAPIPEGEARAHRIYEMSYEQIAAYDCGRPLENFPEQTPASVPKPRLRDVLESAEAYADTHDRGPVFYNIETKSRPEWDGTLHPEPEPFVRRVLAVVTEAGVAPRTTIQSFDPRTLEATHRQNATVRTALLIGRAGNRGLDDNLSTLSFVPDIYSPNAQLVDAALVAAVHDRGLTLIPWTVNDPDDMGRLVRLGVDGLITDYPDRARAVLDAAGP